MDFTVDVVAGRGDLVMVLADVGLFNAFSFNGDVAEVDFVGETELPFVNFDFIVNVVGFGGALKDFIC